jgi:NHL repeat
MLAAYDAKGNFVQSLGDGRFSHPHGLRADSDDNLWTIDDGNHLVLKLNPAGNVLLVLAESILAQKQTGSFTSPLMSPSPGTATFTSAMAMATLAQ